MIVIKDKNNNTKRGYISATDIQLLDEKDKYERKILEDAMQELGSGTEHNMLRIEGKVDKLEEDKTNILKTIGQVDITENGDIASQLKDCAKNIVNINTNGVKKLIQGEILADLDNFLELNTIKSISDITANKPNGVDFASVINLGMQGNNFNQIIADRQGKIFCRGYALWDTPKFKKWQQLATTETAEITLLNGWQKGFGDMSNYITKTGDVVFVNMSLKGGNSANDTVLFNLPNEYKPNSNIVIDGACNWATRAKLFITVRMNGDVVIRGNFNSTDTYILNFNYPTTGGF